MIMRLLCEPSHVALEKTGCCVHCQFTFRVAAAALPCDLTRGGGWGCQLHSPTTRGVGERTLNMREPYPNTTYDVCILIRFTHSRVSSPVKSRHHQL